MEKTPQKSATPRTRLSTCATFVWLGVGGLLLVSVCVALAAKLPSSPPAQAPRVTPATSIADQSAMGIATDAASSIDRNSTTADIQLAVLATPTTKLVLAKPTATDSASAPLAPDPIAIAKLNLIVRTGPATTYKQITTLKQGESVRLVAISSDRGWLKHNKGWSNAAYLITQYDLGKLPVEIVAAPPTRVPTKRPATARPRTAVPPVPIPPTEVIQAPPPSNCDPNYTPCVPIASDVDCARGSGNGPAYVRGPVRVIGRDIYDLDRDGDGIGCE